jgi:hypothetical protein
VEIFVKVGARLVTVARSVEGADTFATVRQGAIALANAVVAKLQ